MDEKYMKKAEEFLNALDSVRDVTNKDEEEKAKERLDEASMVLVGA